MKVIIFAAFLFIGITGYACCKVSGDISRLEEERDRCSHTSEKEQ